MISLISGLVFLLMWSQFQIRVLKNNRVELNKIIAENAEDDETSRKTLLDQFLENSEDRDKIIIQDQEDRYLESFSSVDQPSVKETFEQNCQEEQTTYNSCLIKYNTELLEFQNCQTGEKTFGCPLSSSQPINTCGIGITSWCRKQILGHY